jgi:hypothetical protein
MNLVSLVFFVLPGFLADYFRRVLFGHRKASDFERTILSLAWSAFGLTIVLLVGELIALMRDSKVPPSAFRAPYLGALTAPGTSVTFDGWAFLALLTHTIAAMAIAAGTVKLLRWERLKKALARITSRSLDSAWMQLWTEYQPGRRITVITAKGERVVGKFLAASDESDARDIILGDPLFWDPDAADWKGEGVKIAYYPEAKIEAVYMSTKEPEIPFRGYLSDREKPPPQ